MAQKYSYCLRCNGANTCILNCMCFKIQRARGVLYGSWCSKKSSQYVVKTIKQASSDKCNLKRLIIKKKAYTAFRGQSEENIKNEK